MQAAEVGQRTATAQVQTASSGEQASAAPGFDPLGMDAAAAESLVRGMTTMKAWVQLSAVQDLLLCWFGLGTYASMCCIHLPCSNEQRSALYVRLCHDIAPAYAYVAFTLNTSG